MGKLLLFAGITVVLFLYFQGNSSGKVDFPSGVISSSTPVKTLSAEQKIRVVLFTGTEWCPACRDLDGNVITSPAWKEFAAKEIRFQSVNIPADQSKAKPNDLRLVDLYGVRGFPTMVVLDGAGKELSRQVGSGAPVENYKEWIRQHASHY